MGIEALGMHDLGAAMRRPAELVANHFSKRLITAIGHERNSLLIW